MDVQRNGPRPLSKPAERRNTRGGDRFSGSQESSLRRYLAAFRARGRRAHCGGAIQDAGVRGVDCGELRSDGIAGRQDAAGGTGNYGRTNFCCARWLAARYVSCRATRRGCGEESSANVALSCGDQVPPLVALRSVSGSFKFKTAPSSSVETSARESAWAQTTWRAPTSGDAVRSSS